MTKWEGPLVRYWLSTLDRNVTAEKWQGPRVEAPLQFYKDAISTNRAVEELYLDTAITESRQK